MILKQNSVPAGTFALIIAAGAVLLSSPAFSQQGDPSSLPQVAQFRSHYAASTTNLGTANSCCTLGSQDEGFVWRFANPQLTTTDGASVAANAPNTATHLQFDVEVRSTARLSAEGGISGVTLGLYWEHDGGTPLGAFPAGVEGVSGFPFDCVVENNISELTRQPVAFLGETDRVNLYNFNIGSQLDFTRKQATFTWSAIATRSAWLPNLMGRRSRFMVPRTEYTRLATMRCPIVEDRNRLAQVAFSVWMWREAGVFLDATRGAFIYPSAAANDLFKFAIDGSPSVLEEVVYSDNQRVEVLLTEPLRDPLVTSHYELVDDAGDPVAGVTLDNAFLINSSRTMVFELTGRSETEDIIIRRTAGSDNQIFGTSSSLAMGLARDLATVPAFDPGAPRVVTASFVDNSRVTLEFSEDVYAVNEEDFILEVLNPNAINSVEIASLIYPAPVVMGGDPSTSVVVLELNTFPTGAMTQGDESLRIRFKRNYSGDIAAFYNPILGDPTMGLAIPPKRAATHQVETDALQFESADAPRLTDAAIDATNTTLTLTFDRGVDYVGTDSDNDFTFAVTPGPSGRPHRITVTTATTVVTGASSDTVEVGIETTPAGGRSTAGEDRGTITIMRSAIVNRSSTNIQISGAHNSETFNFRDTERPEAASIEGVDADGNSATNAELNDADNTYTTRWRVTFTEPVTGVDDADFRVCRGNINSGNGASTQCGPVVSAGDFGDLTVIPVSDTIYTVTASGLAQEVGVNADYLLRLNDIGTGIADMASPTPRTQNMRFEGGVLIAADSIAPQVTEVSINDDNTLLTVTFSEDISNPDAGGDTGPISDGVTIQTSAEAGEFSEWITGADKTGVEIGNSTMTVSINLTGPAPLNGESPDGGEVFDVTIAANILRDAVGNNSDTTSAEITLNETAAPQIRDGPANFGANNTEVVSAGSGSEANITWRVRFTETVRNVTTASFTVLVVTDADAGTSQSYSAGTFASGDSFALDDAAKFSVATASGSETTNGGQYADTYEVQTNGLRFLDDAGSLLSYALRMTAATPAVEDDDAGGRDLTGLPQTTPVQLASDDRTAPVLVGAELDATNTTLTLTFTDNDSIRYFGSSATADFTLTQITYPGAPDATRRWITTVTAVAAPVMATSQTLELRIESQGPPPLNGLSPSGGEQWRVEIGADAVSDRSNNQPAPGSSAQFTFNDNANPRIREITARRQGGQVFWVVVFTEPVRNVRSDDFELYRFSTATPAALGDTVEQVGFPLFNPSPEEGGRQYTLFTGLSEVMGSDLYYALVTRAANDIQSLGGGGQIGGQALTPLVQTHPDLVAGIYTHRDVTAPTLVSAIASTDNSQITFTFSEEVQLTTEPSSFVSQVGVSTQTVTSSAGGFDNFMRSELLRLSITGAPTVSSAVVSGTQLILDLNINGPAPFNGDVPIEGPGYLVFTLPPLIADVVGGQPRNALAQTERAVTLNNELRPQVVSVNTNGNAMSTGPGGNYNLRWEVRFTEPVDSVDAADFYVERADDNAFTTNASTADAVISVSGALHLSVFRGYTVSAAVTRSVTDTFYRLRVRDDAQIAERERAEVAVTGAPVLPGSLVYGVHSAPDNVRPQVDEANTSGAMSSDNMSVVIAFDEMLGSGFDGGRFTIELLTGSEWVTSLGTGTPAVSGRNVTIPVTLQGPAPLNGASPNGEEVVRVRLAEGAVSDESTPPNRNAEIVRQFTVNELAAPQVTTFTEAGAEIAVGGVTANLRWQLRFTETVRGVGTEDFTLLSVPSGGGAATEYTGAEYSKNDDMTVNPSPGATSTTVSGEVHYDIYDILVQGLTSSEVSLEVATYALRLDAGAVVTDDDARMLTVLPVTSQELQAVSDITPPVFETALLNAANDRLTLRFDENVRYTGSNPGADFRITVSGGGEFASVTGARVTAVRAGLAEDLVLTLEGLGAAPLNGLSAVGGEQGRVMVSAARIADVGNNNPTSDINTDFGPFNDNAAPHLESAELTATPTQTPGAATQVSWRMVFTEPVNQVTDDDFRIYKLPAADSALSAESGSPAIADLSPNVAGSQAAYTLTLTIPEPIGEDAYYAVSLADGNNIMATGGSSGLRPVPEAGRTAPADATGVATLQDLTAPALVGEPVLSADNGEILYTFNEGVQFVNAAADLVGAVVEARNTNAVTGLLNGVNRVRILQDTITGFDVSAAAISGAEVRLTVNINGTVTIPAPDYLSIAFPANQIADLPAGGSVNYGGATHTFSLADEAQPTVQITINTITINAGANTYTADWNVDFSEPVSGVAAGSFAICRVASATDGCGSGTVVAGAVGTVAPVANSDFRRYTVTAPALAQQVGAVWYRLRVNSAPGIVERLGAGRGLSTALPHTGPAHRAADTVGPVAQTGMTGVSNPGTTASLSVRFSEALDGTPNVGNISVAPTAPLNEREWITGAQVAGASVNASTLTVVVTTTGPAPLNGLSPDGGEQLTLTLAPGAVEDEHGNASPAGEVMFTLNENAAPQVASVSGQSGEVQVDGANRNADLTWTVVFTETVRGVATGSFSLLRVMGEPGAETSATVSLAGRTFTVTTAAGSVMSGGGAYAETYEVLTNVDAGPSGSPNRYILVVMDTADTNVQDDDGKSLGGQRFLSEITSVDDRTPPMVRMAEAAVGASAGQISITVAFNEALQPGSVTALENRLGQFANGVLQNPGAAYATVESARLTDVSLSNNQLVFTANLAGTLDGHESAVGVEQFTFTIPAGLVVDNSARNNATTMATPFTITVPESGEPEVTAFTVVSSEEANPGSDDGLFNITYRVEFTEPVRFPTTATAFVLYRVEDRAPTRIRPAPGSDASLESGLSAPVRITATHEVTGVFADARYLVAYTGVQRPTSNVRGYVAFLDASQAVDAASRTLEDCSWRAGADSGCLSASADVSDTVPPRFAGDQAAYGSGQDRLWVTFNEPISVPGGSDGSSLQGFTVNLLTDTGDEVAVTAALYRPAVQTNDSNGSVELQLAEGVTAQTVFVRYLPPSSGPAIHDDALARGLNDTPNRVVNTLGPQMLALDAARDSDNDGVPDSVEARIGANPWATADNDPRAQNLPELTLTRGTGTAHIAYAGIRADGVLNHLGVSVTTGARARTLAYYSDNCATGQLLSGDCTLVDFGNIPAAVDHRIAWVATNENGYPVTVAQTIHRVRELNMANERLFFLASDADAATLAVEATLDAPTADTLTPVTSPALTFSGLSAMVAKSAISGTSQTYTITGLNDGGGGNVLWRVADGVGALAASSYSLGLSPRTQVVRLGDDFLPPSLGRPTLTDASGDERLGLTQGDFTVTLEALNANAAPTVAEVVTVEGGTSVLTSITPAAFTDGSDEVSMSFTVPAGARNSTRTSVSLRITVPGAGPSESSLLVTWPLVPAGNVLAGVTSDTDADGIPDNIGADRFVGDSALPVAVVAGGREVAGRAPWHHIRAGLPQHRMCVSGLTLQFAAAVDNPFDSYEDWGTSFSTGELEAVGVPSPPQPLRSAYNFGVCGVDYEAAPRSSTDTTVVITGGRAVAVIPLPQNLHDAASLGIYKYRSATGAWQAVAARSDDFEWGFMPLQNGVCPVTNEVPATSAKQPGDACLIVRIRDGGAFDNDGSINGVIDDPIGVRAGGGASGSGGGVGGGGAFGPFGLFAILLSVAALLLRARRRRVNA